jgi:hypothetical protein
VTTTANTNVTITERSFAVIAEALERLTLDDAPTGIVYHPLAHGLDHPKYAGHSEVPLSLLELYQGLFELRFSSIQKNIAPDPADVRATVRTATRRGEVPIGVVSFNYQALTLTAVKRFLAQIRRKGDLSIDDLVVPDVLEQRQLRVCRPLVEWVADGASVTFCFDSAWVLSNSNPTVLGIDFDPGDGNGIRHVGIGSRLTVAYQSAGEKHLCLTCHYSDGSATTHCSLRLLANGLPSPSETVRVKAIREYKGVRAMGTMKIYYANGHTNVVKPFFMWTGFNTDAASTVLNVPTPFDVWDASAELMWAIDPNELLEQARSKGYDIVLIEFDDSRTYIQANAAMIEAAILTINRRPSKVDPGTLVTGSMGGLVARHALLTMEAEGSPHDLSKVVLLDPPMLGAVVPMCVQYGIDFLSDKVNEVRDLRDRVLDSFAARQMLVQKYRSYWSGQDDPQPDDLFAELQESFLKMGGWPKRCDLYAIANGNNAGIGQQKDDGTLLNPADRLSEFRRVDGHNTWKANGLFHALPNYVAPTEPGSEIIFISRVGKLNWRAIVKRSLPWDTCPGSTAAFVKLFANNGWTTHSLIASNTCFVPTLSALGFQIMDDLYATVPGPGNTPYKDFYVPQANEPHATLNDANVAWLKTVLNL